MSHSTISHMLKTKVLTGLKPFFFFDRELNFIAVLKIDGLLLLYFNPSLLWNDLNFPKKFYWIHSFLIFSGNSSSCEEYWKPFSVLFRLLDSQISPFFVKLLQFQSGTKDLLLLSSYSYFACKTQTFHSINFLWRQSK